MKRPCSTGILAICAIGTDIPPDKATTALMIQVIRMQESDYLDNWQLDNWPVRTVTTQTFLSFPG